jgi:hypothetical protein
MPRSFTPRIGSASTPCGKPSTTLLSPPSAYRAYDATEDGVGSVLLIVPALAKGTLVSVDKVADGSQLVVTADSIGGVVHLLICRGGWQALLELGKQDPLRNGTDEASRPILFRYRVDAHSALRLSLRDRERIVAALLRTFLGLRPKQ